MFNREGEQDAGDSFHWTPRWKDRVFGDSKSRDEVIRQLRDELDRQRKMFFERAAHPAWNSAESRGFPFSETARRFADRAGFPHHFNDPEVWAEEGSRQRHPSGGSCRTTSSSGSATSNSSGGAGDDAPCPNSPRFRRPATRSATGQFPPPPPPEAPRGSRASSAPPPPTSNSTPRRFTTTMKVPINEPADNKQQTHQQQTPGVRQIPIFVEGRDEPVLAKLDEEERADKADKPDKPKDEPFDHTKPIPMPFRPQNTEVESSPSAKAIPLPFHDISHPSPASSAPAQEPIPLPFREETAKTVEETSSPMQHSPETEAQVTLSQIESIRREAECLLPRIESFKGSRNDREFLFVDEMLTRLLLKLDLVPVEGRDDVRQTRKDAIGSIQRCISLLESKCCSTIPDTAESDSGISEVSKDLSDTSETSTSEAIALGY